MKTEIVSAQECAKAVALLRAGEIVALPTETVYGLAADALDPIAVAKIFEAKERPRFDPLIVHLPSEEWIERVARIDDLSRKLITALWPGPFTIVVPRREIVPDMVSAGLDTVALRMSSHPIFARIIRDFGKPLAAPSANRFGRISPTTAQHVVDELEGRIPMVVDAGPTAHGLESTIVATCDGRIVILRRGPISEEQLSIFGKTESITAPGRISAPGQLASHYAPRTRLRLIDNAKSFSPKPNQRCALLAWNAVAGGDRFVAVRRLSETQDMREAAANLFRYMRELDTEDVDLILAEPVPDHGLGAAIMDRLRRAANFDVRGTPE